MPVSIYNKGNFGLLFRFILNFICNLLIINYLQFILKIYAIICWYIVDNIKTICIFVS